jgi:AcrR family transcriptional regulator
MGYRIRVVTAHRNEYSFRAVTAAKPAVVAATSDRDRRGAILDAALELFVERGFHGTAVPAVAARAGVGAGTIYRYFASKEALVNALYQRWKLELGARVLGEVPADRPPREQFRALWAGLSRFASEHPRAFAFLELHHHASYLDEASRAVEGQLAQAAGAVFRAAQEQGAVKPGPPELLIALAYGAFVGLVRASWQGQIELTAANLAAAEQCAWEAIRTT